MSEASTVADVYREGEYVGKITRTRAGSVFEYAPGVIRPVAYRMPVSRPQVETSGVNLHPFFAGLLPEGLRLNALIKRVKTSGDDLLSLLVAAGEDTIGDISVVPAGQGASSPPPRADLRELSQLRFADLDVGIDHTAIAGVQLKVSAGRVRVPIRARGARDFILKLGAPDLPRLVENEHFFLEMARACGVRVARASVAQDRDGEAGLLVERFDRRATSGAHVVTKVHQEDACQFLDRYPADKYKLACSEIAAGIQELSSVPIPDLGRFLQLLAFSYLIGNGDLHAKNVSLGTDPFTRLTELTPAYDLLSTLPYGDRKMCLSFEGRTDNFKRVHFVAFGERHGVKAPATVAMLDELRAGAPAWIGRLEEIGLPAKETDDLRRTMSKRLGDLA